MSWADDVEVIPLSSDSDTSVPKKTRRAVRKIPFSHPLAHLDPNLFVKKLQHAGSSRRQTRSGSGELMGGLADTPMTRKRPNEVPHSPTSSHPRAGLFKQPLNPSDSDYQDSPPSSGASSATQLPPMVIKPG